MIIAVLPLGETVARVLSLTDRLEEALDVGDTVALVELNRCPTELLLVATTLGVTMLLDREDKLGLRVIVALPTALDVTLTLTELLILDSGLKDSLEVARPT